MANNPQNPGDDRKNRNQDPLKRESGIIDTKQPDPTNQPNRKTDPSGSAFNEQDDFMDEEE